MEKDPREKDYKLLLEIGRDYLIAGRSTPYGEIEIEPLAVEVLRKGSSAAVGGTEESQAKRLARKFREDQDIILARLTFDALPERIDTLREISEIIERMRKLGIKADAAHVRPIPLPSVT